MEMKVCPYCAEEIQDEAIKCRYCGEFLQESPALGSKALSRSWIGSYGFEYRSELEILGWPLIHIAQGIDPATGRFRVARGIIAIGNLALGVFALGGVSGGIFTIGGLGIGLFTFGGLAIGGIALGGAAFGALLAVGGMAVSLMYAVGGAAIAPYTISAAGADPEIIRLLERWLPGVLEYFGL
jgi:hypothetical protein